MFKSLVDPKSGSQGYNVQVRELVVAKVHDLQALVTGQPCTQPCKALLVQPYTVPLQGQAGQADVQAEESSKQDNGVAAYVVPFQVQRLDRGVLGKTLLGRVITYPAHISISPL